MARKKEPNKNAYFLHLFRSLLHKNLLGTSLSTVTGHLPKECISVLSNYLDSTNIDTSSIREALNKDNPTDYYINKAGASIGKTYFLNWEDFIAKEANDLSGQVENLGKTYSQLNEKNNDIWIKINSAVERRVTELCEPESGINNSNGSNDPSYHLEKAKQYKNTGTEYRNKGSFQQAEANYAHAESEIHLHINQNGNDLTAIIFRWRLEASKIMLKQYFFKADCTDAIKQYNEILEEVAEYTKGKPITEWAELGSYKIHTIRQIAEMYRIMGEYDKALDNFQEAYTQYDDKTQKEAKMYSLLGKADSMRTLGRFNEAENLYDILRQYSQREKDARLEFRTLRNQLELYRLTENRDLYDEVASNIRQKIENQEQYEFGEFYFLIIEGSLNLVRDLDKAEELFIQAKNYAKNDKHTLLLEYAHSLFGLGEVYRFKGLSDKALQHYEDAQKIYKKRNIKYGILRTQKGIEWNDGKAKKAIICDECLTDNALQNYKTAKFDELLLVNVP